MNSLWLPFFVSILFNLCLYVPAYIYKTDKLTDISYALSFVFLAVYAFAKSSQQPLHAMLLFAVLLWAIRLGTFLGLRIWKFGKDKRFDGTREHALKFLRFWLLQGISVFIVLLASLYAFMSNSTHITIVTYTGFAIFLFGLLLEAVADYQKQQFTSSGSNKDKWIDVGVWRMSRHPNYLGEILVWVGLYVAVFPTLQSDARLVAVVSPVYIITLLLFVSGIPLLEKAAQKKWATVKAYSLYKQEVPVIVPSLRSIKRALHK